MYPSMLLLCDYYVTQQYQKNLTFKAKLLLQWTVNRTATRPETLNEPAMTLTLPLCVYVCMREEGGLWGRVG